MKLLPLLLCLFLLAAPHAYPWAAEGHIAIAEAAQGMLTPPVRAKIDAILGHDQLPAVATWLDDARNAKKHFVGPLKSDAEARDFNAKFPDNENWHYVNMPVGISVYPEGTPFAPKTDIVHAIGHAIDVLEGKAADMTPVMALRVLVHLVGDVHQPMHTVAGYYDLHDLTQPKLVSDLKAAAGLPDDRGANQLFYTKSLELHAYWDKKMPVKVQRARPNETLSHQLASELTVQKWLTPGDYREWAAKWAGESAAEAIIAYRGIQFGQATLNADGTLARIEITLPPSYEETETARAKIQLSKGSCHLAQLLNAIRFP